MPFTLRTINHSSFRFLVLLVLVVVSAVLISARWKSDNVVPAPTNSGAHVISQDSRHDTQPEAELVTITPTGFEPDQISRPQGPFILAVDNRSGLDQVDLYLERETGSRTDVQPRRKRKLAWQEKVDLAPGRYLLRAADYPDWRCTITVRP